MKKMLAGLASLIGVAACGEGTPYGHNVEYSQRDKNHDFFFSATARGPLFVDVHGQYPGYERSAGLIKTAMEKGVPARPFKATLHMENATEPSYRVIWVIAPPRSYNANRICKGDIPASETGEKPTFAAIFCNDDNVLRDISGWVRSDVAADSKEFSKFVGTVTRELFR